MYDFFNKTCPLQNSVLYDQDNFWSDGHQWDAHRIGWTVSGAFALVATIFAFTLIFFHLRNYRRPEFQRYYVRIILMIPVYAIVSWLGYRFYRSATYFEFGRDAYEAIVICSFLILMCNFLGTERSTNFKYKRQHLVFPLCCIYATPSGRTFLETLKWCVLQFAIIGPIVSIVAIILESRGVLCPESLSLAFGNIWLQIAKVISVTIATYSLIQFYIVIRKDIGEYRPLLKFISIKLVIFLTFYQNLVFQILGRFGVIKATKYWTAENIEYGLGAIAITVEMFLFCILFTFSFSHKDFQGDIKYGFFRAAIDALNIVDLIVEMGRNLKYFFIRFVLRKKPSPIPDEGKYDIFDAMNKKRDMTIYGGDEQHLLSSLQHEIDRPLETENADEGSGAVANPMTRNKGHSSEDEEIWNEGPPPSIISYDSVPPAYSSTPGDDHHKIQPSSEEKV